MRAKPRPTFIFVCVSTSPLIVVSLSFNRSAPSHTGEGALGKQVNSRILFLTPPTHDSSRLAGHT